MASARLAQGLSAAADQRAAVYTELTALAHGDASDATTGLATATLHIGGLAGEALEDEAQLTERLGCFGTVLALTLRREAEQGSWALVTYADAAESERALEGAAAELGAESVVVRRLDTQQALGSAGPTNQAMVEQRRRVEVRVAASCVGPLVAVLCKPVSDVDSEEYQRASLCLGGLCWMDREVRRYPVWPCPNRGATWQSCILTAGVFAGDRAVYAQRALRNTLGCQGDRSRCRVYKGSS